MSDDGTLQLEGLAAIPDLAAGALADIFSLTKRLHGIAASRVMVPVPSKLTPKTRMIAGWLSDDGEVPHPLRKLIVIVDDVDVGMHKTSIVHFNVENPIPEFDWRQEVHQ